MTYNIQFIAAPTDANIKALVIEKLDILSLKYGWIVKANIVFKAGQKDTTRGCTCDIKLSGPGPLLFASSSERNFEMAIAETVRDLSVQLKKRKAIMKSKEGESYKSS